MFLSLGLMLTVQYLPYQQPTLTNLKSRISQKSVLGLKTISPTLFMTTRFVFFFQKKPLASAAKS